MFQEPLGQWLFSHFRRITSSSAFFPEIDGLRFLALASVVVYHAHASLIASISARGIFLRRSWLYDHVLERVFSAGYQGVFLFFVISGFILARPFVRARLGLARNPSYGKYLRRRLTRLEPPYILTALIRFFIALWVVKKYALPALWPSALASLSYTHNLFYPQELPRINPVFWTLEIEVQFYLLAPALCRLYFLGKGAMLRRGVALLVLEAWTFFGEAIPGRSILNYGYFFVLGILLCDMIASREEPPPAFQKAWAAFLGAILLAALLWLDFALPGGKPLKLTYPVIVLLFYLIVIWNPVWRRIFSYAPLVLIGGMCYSAYMWHGIVINCVCNFAVRFGQKLPFDLFLIAQFILYLGSVLVASAIFYKLVERPCMDQNWPARLKVGLRKSWPMTALGRRSPVSGRIDS